MLIGPLAATVVVLAAAAMACAAALIHYARHRAPFTVSMAAAGALYARFGALKLTFGNAWLHP